jgi:hypothetical protein
VAASETTQTSVRVLRSRLAAEIEDVSARRLGQLHQGAQLGDRFREAPLGKHERIHLDPEGVIVEPLLPFGRRQAPISDAVN